MYIFICNGSDLKPNIQLQNLPTFCILIPGAWLMVNYFSQNM